MPNTVPRTTRKPAPKHIPRTAYSPPPPPPRRIRNVAFRDNQTRREDSPQDVETTSKTVFDLAAVEPLKAAKHCQAAIAAATGGFHKEMRRLMAVAYAIARALQNDRQAWRTFIEDPFWEKRKRPPKMDDRGRPLLHVMVFVFGAIDRNIYKRAQKYAAGLKQYWRHNVPAHEVEAKIAEDGGIEALSQASAESKPKKAKPSQSLLKLCSASEALTKALLALPVGQEAHLIIRRVTGERGAVAMIMSVDSVKT